MVDIMGACFREAEEAWVEMEATVEAVEALEELAVIRARWMEMEIGRAAVAVVLTVALAMMAREAMAAPPSQWGEILAEGSGEAKPEMVGALRQRPQALEARRAVVAAMEEALVSWPAPLVATAAEAALV